MAKLRAHLVPGICALLAGFGTGILVLRWAWPWPVSGPSGPAVTGAAPSAGAGKAWDEGLGRPPRFVDVTRAAGISFRHENGLTGRFLYPEIMGGGVGLFDYNGDGYLDIYFVNGNRLEGQLSPDITDRLYRNNGDWTFTDMTAQADVGDPGYGQGCCAADYDNDGDADLYVSNLGPNVLYRNEGNGTFSDVTAAAGVGDAGWGQTSSFLDHDRDGWLDIYAQNYLTFSPETQQDAFVFVGDRKVSDYPSPLGFKGSSSRLYRNLGNGTFADVTEKAGLLRPDGKGMGTACADLDDDGDTDIFVANDTAENFLFRNEGNGTFREVGLSAGVAYDMNGIPEAFMGVDVGDYDGDGRMDLIVPCLQRQVFALYRNEGEHFTDVCVTAGLVEATSRSTGFSSNFIDYDNDGDLDLFFTNGGVRRSETAPPGASYNECYGMTALLLANNGRGRYSDVSARAGPYFQERLIGRGSAAGDLDNDGDIDLVVSNLADRAVVLRNETDGGHWITLRLLPERGNKDAIGASVWIEAGGRKQRAMVHGGVTYLSQGDRRVHFGLGSAEKIDRLEVLWPDGTRQVLEGMPVDQLMTVRQGR